MAHKTDVAQGSHVDPVELLRVAKDILCGPTEYGPGTMVVSGHVLNGLLDSKDYDINEIYYITSEGIYQIVEDANGSPEDTDQ